MRTGRDLIKEIRAKVSEVDPTEVHELRARNGSEPDFVIVDVREQAEWDQGHIPGAIHIPRSYLESRFENFVPERDKKIVLYCKSGARSAEALAVVKNAGFADAVHVGGGVLSWVKTVDPSLPTY